MTDVTSDGVRPDAPPRDEADVPTPDPTIILEDQTTLPQPTGIELLRTELAVTKERLRAMEDLAKERAGRIADLRVILRMLPASSRGVARPAEASPSSLIWVPDRGTEGPRGQDPRASPTGWSRPEAPPRSGEHSERIWQRSPVDRPDPDPAAATPTPPVVPAEDHDPPDPTEETDTGATEWREVDQDYPPPRHRRRPWFRRLRRSRD